MQLLLSLIALILSRIGKYVNAILYRYPISDLNAALKRKSIIDIRLLKELSLNTLSEVEDFIDSCKRVFKTKPITYNTHTTRVNAAVTKLKPGFIISN